MYNFKFYLTYNSNGKVVKSDLSENSNYSLDFIQDENSVRCILHPKKKLELISFWLEADRPMTDDEVFFVNGFQSWSTCEEVKKNDFVRDIIPIVKVSGFTKHVCAMSGDNLFTNYGKKGLFHSFTYTYFRNGNDIELFGSKCEKTGYTIFEVDSSADKFYIKKDVEGVICDSDYSLMDVCTVKDNYDAAFDFYFDSLNLRKSKINHLSGYTSWYNYFQNISEDIIIRDLNGLDKVKDSVSIFQIDDGYETFVGDWLDVDKKKFPKGMKYCADEIHKKGYLAGIWIAPFSSQRVSKLTKEHPDWLLKTKNGKNMWGTFAWNGAYTLDLYNEEARAYIKHFFDVILNEWGYDMVKLDFLYSQAIYPRNGKSRGQIMCEAMEFLRECVGEDKLFLGCGVPLGPSFGIVDACRVTCDVDLDYKGKFYNALHVNREVPSAQNSMNNTILRRHLNQRVFCNDPDVFFLRKNNLKFNDEQKKILATVNNMFGDVLFVSDNAGDYGENENSLVKNYFAVNDVKIISAEYKTKDIISIKYLEGENEKKFEFNITEGKILS